MDWDEVKEKIDSSRNIKASTLKSYIGNLKKIFKEIGAKEIKKSKPLEWIDMEGVLDYLDGKSDHTVRNMLNSLIIYVELFDNNKELLEELKELHNEYRKTIEDNYKAGVKSDKQENNWMSMSELLKVVRKLKRELDEREVFEKSKISMSDLNLLQRWVISFLYAGDPDNHPPTRLENYSEMKVIDKSKYDDMSKSVKDDFNWLVVENKKNKKFVFNKYKTADKYGSVEIPLSKPMNAVMNIWLKYKPEGEYLLSNYRNNKKISSNNLGKIVGDIFTIKGKTATANLIRSMFVSEKYPKEKSLEQQSTAKKMGHSVSVQNNVYSKKEDN